MSTINGIGTRYLSWNHQNDGTCFATIWFCILYIPIFPITRHHIRIVNDVDKEKIIGLKEAIIAISPHKTIIDKYEIINITKLNIKEISNTYLYSYIIHPLILASPFIALVIMIKLLGDSVRNKEWFLWFAIIYILISFGFVIAYSAALLHRSRGGKT